MRKIIRYKIITGMMGLSLLFAQIEKWVYTYDGSGNSKDESFSICCGNGNIYTSGKVTGNGKFLS